jgi:hypothetical protein
MFTWICPKCGREVPPSYSECPNCASGSQTSASPAAADAPSAPAAVPPTAPAEPFARRYHLPSWAITLFVAVALVSLGVSIYLATRSTKPAAQTEEKSAAAAPAIKRHPLSKHIEVAGIRITEDAAQKAQVEFLVVNHSGADIADLGGMLTLKPRGAKPEHAPLASFEFKVPSIGPYESKELKTTVRSNMRAYELPDWQFLQADLEITSPAVTQ